jgi:hypothetical protein
MGRTYAGILGPLACALVVARGVLHGAGAEGTLLSASGALFAFAALGYIVGQVADYLIRDSVRTQFQSAMADWEKKQHPTQPQPTT